MSSLVDKTALSVVWLTPPRVLDVCRRAAHVERFALDPCTEPSNPTGAVVFYTEADDGLTRSWTADLLALSQLRKVVWMNPPYGLSYSKWLDKLHVACNTMRDVGVPFVLYALLPANRTETDYIQRLMRDPSLLCMVYVRKRLRFTRPDGSKAKSNPYPSMLYVFAHGLSVDAGILGELGVVVPWCVAPEANQQ